MTPKIRTKIYMTSTRNEVVVEKQDEAGHWVAYDCQPIRHPDKYPEGIRKRGQKREPTPEFLHAKKERWHLGRILCELHGIVYRHPPVVSTEISMSQRVRKPMRSVNDIAMSAMQMELQGGEA